MVGMDMILGKTAELGLDSTDKLYLLTQDPVCQSSHHPLLDTNTLAKLQNQLCHLPTSHPQIHSGITVLQALKSNHPLPLSINPTGVHVHHPQIAQYSSLVTPSPVDLGMIVE